jgi:hypothetical protein
MFLREGRLAVLTDSIRHAGLAPIALSRYAANCFSVSAASRC